MFLLHTWLLVVKTLRLKLAEPVKSVIELIVPAFFAGILGLAYHVAHTPHTGAHVYTDPVPNATSQLPLGFCVNSTNTTYGATLGVTSCPGLKPAGNEIIPGVFSRSAVAGHEAEVAAVMDAELSHRPRLLATFDGFVLMSTFFHYNAPDLARQFAPKEPLSHIGKLIVTAPNGNVNAIQAFKRFCQRRSSACGAILFDDDTITENAAVELARRKGGVWAVLVLQGDLANGAAAPTDFQFTIRMNYTSTPLTNFPEFLFRQHADSGEAHYATSGFMVLQQMVNDFAMELGAGSDFNATQASPIGSPRNWAFGTMPTPAFVSNNFLRLGGKYIPLAMVFAFLYSLSRVLSLLVEEKELRLREALFIMGLRPEAHRASWLIVAAGGNVVSCLLATLVGRLTFLHQADASLVFVLHFLFANSVTGFGVLLASLFGRARIAALVGPIIFLIGTAPHFSIPEHQPLGVRYALALLPGSAYANSLALVSARVGAGSEAGWSMLLDNPDDFCVLACMIAMAAATLLYLVLGRYLDAVLPSEIGVRHHPLFFLPDAVRRRLPSIIGGTLSAAPTDVASVSLPDNAARDALRIDGLTKRFGDQTAVSDLSVDVRQGEIVALLGHNGAGKSTTMHMVTGMLTPTAGDAFVGGWSIRRDVEQCRQRIGYCPQHNILWPKLSTRFHLQLFARIKGQNPAEAAAAAERMAEAVDLTSQIDVRAGQLSGGQKRKLSVGIALVGDSPFVVLDEPTAGMDAGARRHLWDLLQASRGAGKAFLVSTHYMDEADLLGDRIAIMGRGHLRAFDTPLGLKSQFGAGYQLHCVANAAGADAARAIVGRYVPELAAASPSADGAGSGDAVFRLPKMLIDDGSRSAAMFADLEDAARKSETTGLRSFGLTLTTLEDVFLSIAAPDLTQDKDTTTPPKPGDSGSVNGTPAVDVNVLSGNNLEGQLQVEGAGAVLRQFGAMFAKRCHCAKRDRRLLVFQLLLPVGFIAIAFALGSLGPPKQPVLALDASMYPKGQRANDIVCPAGSPFELMAADLPSEYHATPVTLAGPWHPAANASAQLSEMSELLLRQVFKHGHVPRRIAVASVPRQMQWEYTVDYPDTIVLINTTADHGAPEALNALSAARLRRAVALKHGAGRAAKTRLAVVNHPMPLSYYASRIISAVQRVISALFILIAFTFIPAQYASFIVRERENKATHQQFVSGASPLAYWASSFAFDLFSYMITVLIAMVIFLAFHRVEFIGSPDVAFGTILLFGAYGVASAPWAYMMSFFFNSHTAAQNVTMMVSFVAGFVLVLASQVMSTLPSTSEANSKLVYIYRLFPAFALGEGIVMLSVRSLAVILEGSDASGVFSLITFDTDVHFMKGGIGTALLYLFGTAPVYFAVCVALQRWSPAAVWAVVKATFRRQRKHASDSEEVHTEPLLDGAGTTARDEDCDIKEERLAVEAGRQDDCLTVEGLTKIYTAPKVAVDDVTFGVRRGEIFGFLGTNGAGKTTTMGVLTGEHLPTRGTASVGGHDVLTSRAQASRLLGYCPQFDALHPEMTPDEHMWLYCRLKGVPGPDIASSADALLTALGVVAYRKVPARALSGGNRRKLSLAIALVGAPQVALLDEPSAGMDPVARRELWRALRHVAVNRSVVLTTHHLEEVEALADRVAIMAAGRMQCIGTLQHLKSRFGTGTYEVAARCRTTEGWDRLSQLAVETKGRIVESHGVQGTLAFDGMPLSTIFEFVGRVREECGVVDVGVNQPSIEQVFLRISAAADPDAIVDRD